MACKALLVHSLFTCSSCCKRKRHPSCRQGCSAGHGLWRNRRQFQNSSWMATCSQIATGEGNLFHNQRVSKFIQGNRAIRSCKAGPCVRFWFPLLVWMQEVRTGRAKVPHIRADMAYEISASAARLTHLCTPPDSDCDVQAVLLRSTGH